MPILECDVCGKRHNSFASRTCPDCAYAKEEAAKAARTKAAEEDAKTVTTFMELSRLAESWGVAGDAHNVIADVGNENKLILGAMLRVAKAVEKMQKDIAILVKPLKQRRRKADRRGW